MSAWLVSRDVVRRRGRQLLGYGLRLGPTQGSLATPFGRLAAVHWLSAAGDAFVPIALAGSLFFSISLTAARTRVELALVLTLAPFAVVAPFLGPIIDRIRGGRRTMVLISALGRAVAVYFMAKYVHSLLLFPWALVALIGSKTYTVAKASLVPAVVDRPEQLVGANSKLALGSAVLGTLAAGPAIAILKVFSAATVLRVDILIYAALAVMTLRLTPPAPGAVRRPGLAPVERDDRPVPAPAGRRLPPGGLGLAWVAMASLRLIVGFLAFLVVFSFRHQSAPLYWYGIVGLANALGNVGGAVIAPRLRQLLTEERMLLGANLIVAVTALIVTQISVNNYWPAALILAAALGLAANAAKLAFDSMVQRDVPPAQRGKLFARTEASFQLVWVVGALVPVLVTIDLLPGIVIVALISAAGFALFLLGLARAEQGSLPAWWPGEGRRRRDAECSPPARAQDPGEALAGSVGVAGPLGAPANTAQVPVTAAQAPVTAAQAPATAAQAPVAVPSEPPAGHRRSAVVWPTEDPGAGPPGASPPAAAG